MEHLCINVNSMHRGDTAVFNESVRMIYTRSPAISHTPLQLTYNMYDKEQTWLISFTAAIDLADISTVA